MRKFFSDLKDKIEEEREKKNGKVSSKPSPQAGVTSPPNSSVDGLVHPMGTMNLDQRPQGDDGLTHAMGAMSLGQRPHAGSSSSGSGFIGGFACVCLHDHS